MFKVDCFDSSTVQLVSQCKLPTKQLHDLKWPALGLTALMLATCGHVTVICVCVCVCLRVFLHSCPLRRVAGSLSIAHWVSEKRSLTLIRLWRHLLVCDILNRLLSNWPMLCLAMWVLSLHLILFCHSDFLADHQGISETDHHTNTGFGSFKLPTCEWLQKGRSHSQMESSLHVV